MSRRRACTLAASLALHAGALAAALLLLSGESELGALFIDLTHLAEAGDWGASVSGGGPGSAVRSAVDSGARSLSRRPALAASPPSGPLEPLLPGERPAQAPHVAPAPASPAPPTTAVVAASSAPSAVAASAAGHDDSGSPAGSSGASGSAAAGLGSTSVGGGPAAGVGLRGGGGAGTAPDVSRGLAHAAPGVGGAAGQGAEYGPYLMDLRRRVQQSLRYPPAARRRGLTGTVALDIVIHADGTLGTVAIADSSSHDVLDDAALEAVKRLAPEPFPSGVAPRVLRIRLPVVFALE